MSTKAEQIVAGLGGPGNIADLAGCISRLRTEVNDPALVDERALRLAGAHGIYRRGSAVQVVVGLDADPLAEDIEALL